MKQEIIMTKANIKKEDRKVAAFTDNDKDYTDILPDTIVSMNMWGFSKGFMAELKKAYTSNDVTLLVIFFF